MMSMLDILSVFYGNKIRLKLKTEKSLFVYVLLFTCAVKITHVRRIWNKN